MNEIEQEAVRGLVVSTLTGATRASIEAGIDPGVILAHLAAVAMSTLLGHGVPKEAILDLVEIAENANARAVLEAMTPAGSA